MAKPPLGGWGSLRGFLGGLFEGSWGPRPYIAQTIKSFEKALHEIFPQPFPMPAILVLSAQLAPSIFSLGPNDLAKEPHSEAHSGRTTPRKARLAKPLGPEKPPSGGWGAIGGLVIKKRETLACFPCSCKNSKKMTKNQTQQEKSGQRTPPSAMKQAATGPIARKRKGFSLLPLPTLSPAPSCPRSHPWRCVQCRDNRPSPRGWDR